jgi:polyphenol oxidase
MKEHHDNGLPFFRFDNFPTNGQQHAIFTRQGGVSPAPFDTLNMSISVADDHANVYANRQRAYSLYGRTNDTLAHAHLTHGAEVALVNHQDHGRLAGRVDGLITNLPGCGLTMNFADCAPIFLYDPEKQAIGLGHAGWQGAVKHLPAALVKAMQEAFGSDPAALLAGVGPCIGPCCYEIGEPVITAVQQAFPNDPSLLIANDGPRPHFDLPAANRRSLQAAGVRHVELAGLCTACRTDLFFSHRAEKGKTGRFGVLFILGE